MRAILFSLMILILFLPVTQAAISVCEKGCDFSSIQAGIDAAEEGDTVVAEGFFFENLNITKSIILTGNATLYPSGLKAAVSISADYVEVSGLNIRGGITGIEVVSSEGVKIKNCNFNRNFYGILISGSSKCTIEGNNFEDINESAIRLVNSNSNSVSSNHIDGSKVAVHLLQSSENNLTDSSFTDVGAGVYLEGSSANNITGNEIFAEEAVSIYQSGENRISDNSADGNVFIRLLFSSKNKIEQNDANGIYANFNSWKNDFILENLKLTGEEFQFSIAESKLPDEFIPLSNALNITVIPDLITEMGYVELEVSESNLKEVSLSSVGFYRVTEAGMERISGGHIENGTAKTNVTVKESGLYLFAGKKETKSETIIPPVISESISSNNYYLHLILLIIVAVAVFLLVRIRRR